MNRDSYKKDLGTAVREICLSFPDTEEVPSRGSPDFRVRGKTFATYVINHHGDGHVALWLAAPPGSQQLHTEMAAEHYFVPPYVGPRGWLGVDLNKGLLWTAIASRVREAYQQIAPAKLINSLGDTINIVPPDRLPTPQEINPFLGARAQTALAILDEICSPLPETSQSTQFGNPVWKAGKKTFVSTHFHTGRLALSFWVGVEQQAMLTFDERYRISAYTGHSGWIDLDVEEDANRAEIENLSLASYRHFALKRMLKTLDDPQR